MKLELGCTECEQVEGWSLAGFDGGLLEEVYRCNHCGDLVPASKLLERQYEQEEEEERLSFLAELEQDYRDEREQAYRPF